MNPIAVLTGFVPFIAFDVLSERDAARAIGWAAVVALALTAFVLIAAGKNRGSTVLNGASIAIFVTLAGLDFLGGPAMRSWLGTWAAAFVMVALGGIILLVLPIRPFTESIARQSVPREYWGAPTFIRINRVLSAAWGVGLLALGLLSVLAVALSRSGIGAAGDHLDLVLNWLIPIAVYIALVKFTIAYPEHARGARGAAAASSAELQAGRPE